MGQFHCVWVFPAFAGMSGQSWLALISGSSYEQIQLFWFFGLYSGSFSVLYWTFFWDKIYFCMAPSAPEGAGDSFGLCPILV